MINRRSLARAAALAAAAAVLAACTAGEPIAAPPAGAVHVIAEGQDFTTASVAAPSGAPVTLYFENRDAMPHNVHVRDAAGATVARGEVFGGPAARPLELPPLAAGVYAFSCDPHPNMTGELVVSTP